MSAIYLSASRGYPGELDTCLDFNVHHHVNQSYSFHALSCPSHSHLRLIRANCLRSRSKAFLSFLLDHIPERYFIRRIFLTISRKTGFQTSFYMWMIECIQCHSHRAYFHDCMGSKAPETQRIKAKWMISSWVLKTHNRLEFENTSISNRALAFGGIQVRVSIEVLMAIGIDCLHGG